MTEQFKFICKQKIQFFILSPSALRSKKTKKNNFFKIEQMTKKIRYYFL